MWRSGGGAVLFWSATAARLPVSPLSHARGSVSFSPYLCETCNRPSATWQRDRAARARTGAVISPPASLVRAADQHPARRLTPAACAPCEARTATWTHESPPRRRVLDTPKAPRCTAARGVARSLVRADVSALGPAARRRAARRRSEPLGAARSRSAPPRARTRHDDIRRCAVAVAASPPPRALYLPPFLPFFPLPPLPLGTSTGASARPPVKNLT